MNRERLVGYNTDKTSGWESTMVMDGEQHGGDSPNKPRPDTRHGNSDVRDGGPVGSQSPDSDYASASTPISDDPDANKCKSSVNGSLEAGWKYGINMSSGVLDSSGYWPLAEGPPDDARYVKQYEETSLMNARDKRPAGPNVEEEEENTTFKFRLLTKSQKIILVSTCFINLLSFLSLSILAPFFPIEADKKNVNGTISGWIFGVFALVQFLVSPLFGRLVPIVGSKFMYLSGLFVTCICTFLFGILDMVSVEDGATPFITLCFLVRMMLALGCTSINIAGFVLLVKAFPDNVAMVFGIGEVFTGIGMVLGPALGGFLYAAGGFFLPFAVIGGCCLIALPIVWIVIPTQDDSLEEESKSLSMWNLVFNPRSIVNSVTVIVAAAIWSILDPTLEPHLRVYGLGPEIVGVLFLIMAACYSVTSPLLGSLADRMPDNRILLIPGFILAATGLLLIGPSPALGFKLSYNELWLTIVSLVVIGVASSIVVIPTYDIYIDILCDIGYPEDTRAYGMVSGLWVSMYALGDFIGPSLGGFLNDDIGFEWMTTGVAAVCLATSVLVAVTWFIEAKCCKKKCVDDRTFTDRPPLLLDNEPEKEASPLLSDDKPATGGRTVLLDNDPANERMPLLFNN